MFKILGSDTDDSLSVLSSNVHNSCSPNIYPPFDDTSSELIYSNSSNNNWIKFYWLITKKSSILKV